jgi:nitrite reductase (NO-forming)
LPVLETPGLPDRGPDRHLTVVGAVWASAFLALALGSLLLPAEIRRGAWLPLHLALAGGAGLAIAAVLPFFATSLAAAPPAPYRRRMAAIGLVAAGAAAAIVGVPAGIPGLAAGGASSFTVGVALVAWSAFGPLRHRRRRPNSAVLVAYAVALAEVGVGVALMGLTQAGWTTLAERPLELRAAHAWLNLMGFVSLVVAGTLVHLLPTVLGARIVAGRLAGIAVAGLAAGAPLVAIGMLGGLDGVARAGAMATFLGAIGLAAVAGRAIRDRGRWTTDAGWHRFIVGCLGSAVAWFVIAASLSAGPIVAGGADPAAWSLDRVAGPLVAGWVGLAILGASTHLVPSIGRGTPERHARQRAWLGRSATGRLAALELGVALLAVGLPAGLAPAVTAGTVLLGLGAASTAGLLAMAVTTPDPAAAG